MFDSKNNQWINIVHLILIKGCQAEKTKIIKNQYFLYALTMKEVLVQRNICVAP